MSEIPSGIVLWTIENFAYCTKQYHETLDSGVFSIDTLYQSEWVLRMHPNAGDLRVYLHNINYEKNVDLILDYDISFLSKDGSVLWTGSMKDREIGFYVAYELYEYPSREEVCQNRAKDYLPQGALTVRCRFWKSGKDLKQPILYNAFTRIEIERRIFNFSFKELSKLIDERAITRWITVGKDKMRFCVEFSLTGDSFCDTNANIKIKKVDRCYSRIFSTVKISVLNGRDIVVRESKEEKALLDLKQTLLNFPNFLTENELTGKNCEILETDVLNLIFNLTFSFGEVYSNTECVTSLPTCVQHPTEYDCDIAKHLQNNYLNDMPSPVHANHQRETLAILQKDFLALYKDRNLSDFELRCKTASFPVHKSVLAARSPVFKVMFSSGMKEGNDNFMDIPDIDADVLDKLLVFIYTGNVEMVNWTSTSKLYYAADKYDVVSLKQKCSILLSDNLSDSNVGDILLHAERHNDDALKSSVHNFIMLNDGRIIPSNEWKQFLKNNSALGAETMRLIYAKKIGMLAK